MFQIWVRQVSFFSGTQIFESEFRASLLPSSCLSTYSPVPSWGQGGHRMPELRLVAWLLGLAASKHSTALASSSHVWAGALCSRPGGRHTRLAARDRHISRWHPGSSGSVGHFQLKQLTCKNSSNCQILLVKKGFCPSRARCVWPTASSLLDGFGFGDRHSHLPIFRLCRITQTLRAVGPTCCSMRSATCGFKRRTYAKCGLNSTLLTLQCF